MSNQNGNINAPIEWPDPYEATGTGTGGMSYDIGTINSNPAGKTDKWSREKPIRGEWVGETDFYNHNAQKQTGIYAGSRGQEPGKPVYWGMKYPMNTAQQNGCGAADGRLLQMCHDVCVKGPSNKHPNYEYVPLVDGIDAYRSTDWEGYDGNAVPFLAAGVEGSDTAGKKLATVKINMFDNADIGFFALVPSDATGWELKDLIPEPQNYHLIVELYKFEQFSSSAGDKRTQEPFAVFASKETFSTAQGQAISFRVAMSLIRSLHGSFNGNGWTQILACTGFNKISSSVTKTDKGAYWQLPKSYAAATGTAFIAPWETGRGGDCPATLIEAFAGSVYTVRFLKWASPTDTNYVDFSTTKQSGYADLRFKASITNSGTTQAVIDSATTESGHDGHLIFRATAIGNFNDRRNDGAIPNPMTGNPVLLRVSDTPGLTQYKSITVPAGATKTFYCERGANGATPLFPYGTTTCIIIEVSNDSGQHWSVTGNPICHFVRT